MTKKFFQIKKKMYFCTAKNGTVTICAKQNVAHLVAGILKIITHHKTSQPQYYLHYKDD